MDQQVTPGKMPRQEQLLQIPPAHGCPHPSCPWLPTSPEPGLGAAPCPAGKRQHPHRSGAESIQTRAGSAGAAPAASCSRSGCSPPPPSVAHSSHLSPPRLALEQQGELGLVSSVLAHPQAGSTLGLASVVQEGKIPPRAGGQQERTKNLLQQHTEGDFGGETLQVACPEHGGCPAKNSSLLLPVAPAGCSTGSRGWTHWLMLGKCAGTLKLDLEGFWYAGPRFVSR